MTWALDGLEPESFTIWEIFNPEKESLEGENRVALTPEGVQKLRKMNFQVQIESGAGKNASFSDSLYEKAGAKVVPDVWKNDMIIKGNLKLQFIWAKHLYILIYSELNIR